MSILEVKNLVKSYGDIEAVRDFSFSLNKGDIYALVGPDGAGKTSIMRSICNLIDINSGEILINGENIYKNSVKIKTILGYMPQVFSLYPDLSVEENLKFYAGIYGITGEEYIKKSEELYQFSNLKPFKKRRVHALSGGMKQKLALSCALIHEPKILVLDEPTTGVDPLSRRQFWEILLNLKREGVSILVSTPYMDEVARADHACFIFEGRKLSEGTPKELPKIFQGNLFYIDIEPTSSIVRKISTIHGISARRFGAGLHLTIGNNDSIEKYQTQLSELGINQDVIKPIEADLEDCFIQQMEK